MDKEYHELISQLCMNKKKGETKKVKRKNKKVHLKKQFRPTLLVRTYFKLLS